MPLIYSGQATASSVGLGLQGSSQVKGRKENCAPKAVHTSVFPWKDLPSVPSGPGKSPKLVSLINAKLSFCWKRGLGTWRGSMKSGQCCVQGGARWLQVFSYISRLA